jgi:predicted nucleic acid-binding protein
LIYLDTSVALAHLFGENRAPPSTLWRERLVSSQLLAYELWNRIHTRGLTRSHADEAKALLAFVSLIDLTPSALARALEPFPTPIGTLDGLHLATIEFLRAGGEDIELASYDQRLIAAAQALGIALYPL